MVEACSDRGGDQSSTTPGDDGGIQFDTGARSPEASPPTSQPVQDAGVAIQDANGPLEAGTTCAFNRECQGGLRCECSEASGCTCTAGARGTGQNGIDPCTSGNDCSSSLCVEGPLDSGLFCSDECTANVDCKGQLPLCKDVSFVGRVCVRPPPG